jgi:transketolase
MLLYFAASGPGAAVPAIHTAVPLEAKRFRQLGSVCAGHPEHGPTSGVNALLAARAGAGAAWVWRSRASRAALQPPASHSADYTVYAPVYDGCMMEGLGHEAASLAGHLRLGNLCWIYDSNQVTIEGPTGLAFSEDVQARFRAYGWQVIHLDDVEDLDALRAAYAWSRQTPDRPTLIVVETVIELAPH